MRLLAIPTALMAGLGLGLSCPILVLLAANPSRQVLGQAQYHAYYPFYTLGPHLQTLSWLGLLAAALAVLCLLLFAFDQFRLRTPGRLTLPRLVLLGLQTWWLLLCAGLSWFLWTTTGALAHPYSPLWPALLVVAPVTFAAALLLCAWGCWRYRGLADLAAMGASWQGGPGGAAVMVGAAWLFWFTTWLLLPDPLTLAQAAQFQAFLIPPFLWTHFGPWAIIAWHVAMCAWLGLAMGVGICGLAPEGPDGLVPVHRRSLAVVGAGVAMLSLIALRMALGSCQIGHDLRADLTLGMETLPGRTVVWLDRPRPAERSGPVQTRLAGANLETLAAWLGGGRALSVQTRSAVAGLANRALWDWEPDKALALLAVQRDRQLHNSRLNDVMIGVLQTSMPTPERARLAREFADPQRFAWLGPEALERMGCMLSRFERAGATSWLDAAQALDGQPRRLPPSPTARVRGTLLLDGRPLAGARVALMRGAVERLLAEESELVRSEQVWQPRSRPAVSVPHLRALYGVTTTDASGRFELGPLDAGSYLPLVRLEGSEEVQVEGGCGLVTLAAGETRELGTLRLRKQ